MSSHNTEILIVDESSNIRATIADYLGDDYIIYYAQNGEDGWKLLHTNESISLVFTDMHMALSDDMLLLQKIREAKCERLANIPVIMITSADETDEAKRAAYNIGATDYISKPFDKIDILSRTRSYTKFNQQIANLEKEAAYDTLTGLYSNRMLLDFGHKTISFANRHNVDASVLYVEIADMQQLIETHGSKATGTIVSTVAGLLEDSIRNEELVAHLDDGRFAIVLPNTKAFMAQIVASRVKDAVAELVFTFSNVRTQVDLAVGLCSTEVNDTSPKLAFEEYCLRAAHALRASLETPNHRIVRHDETHLEKTDRESFHNPAATHTTTDSVEHERFPAQAQAEYFSGILRGDYSSIPAESLPALIEPLENFIEYALTTIQGKQKAAGE